MSKTLFNRSRNLIVCTYYLIEKKNQYLTIRANMDNFLKNTIKWRQFFRFYYLILLYPFPLLGTRRGLFQNFTGILNKLKFFFYVFQTNWKEHLFLIQTVNQLVVQLFKKLERCLILFMMVIFCLKMNS